MSKKHLSQNQVRRMTHKHEKRLERHLEQQEQFDEDHFLAQQNGTVVTRFGKVADVEDEQGQIYRCDIRRTLKSIVTGDKVLWRKAQNPAEKGIIEALHPRQNELARPDFYDGVKVIAANIDQVLILSALEPELSFNMIDRYLIACGQSQLKPIILLNKVELMPPENKAEIEERFAYYRKLGYETCFISCETGENIDQLHALLKHQTSILVGQSGVGKSSLLQQLKPQTNEEVQVGAISATSKLGQHTTTASRLYHLKQGGDLIDSPGVREFGLWHLSKDEILNGFIEFLDYLSDCQFRDCNHLTDKNCGILKAVASKHIADWRYDNFVRILKNSDEMSTRTNKRF